MQPNFYIVEKETFSPIKQKISFRVGKSQGQSLLSLQIQMFLLQCRFQVPLTFPSNAFLLLYRRCPRPYGWRLHPRTDSRTNLTKNIHFCQPLTQNLFNLNTHQNILFKGDYVHLTIEFWKILHKDEVKVIHLSSTGCRNHTVFLSSTFLY